MTGEGQLPAITPLHIEDDELNLVALQKQIQDLSKAVRELSGDSLAKGSIGFPLADFPETVVEVAQVGTTSHLTPVAVQSRDGQSNIKSLDAQLFILSQPSGDPNGVNYTFAHPNQFNRVILPRIPHNLGRPPKGIFVYESNFRILFSNNAGSEWNGFAPAIPSFGDRRVAIDAAGVNVGGTDSYFNDQDEFFITMSWPPARNLNNATIILPTNYSRFQGRFLLF